MGDQRVRLNVTALVKPAKSGRARREGQMLSLEELHDLAQACRGEYADIVLFLGYQGLRWGELAGMQIGDLVHVPGPGVRLQRAVLTSKAGGGLFVDTLKNHRARTVPLVPPAQEIVIRWAARQSARDAWLFHAPQGGPLSLENWRRSVRWKEAITRPVWAPRGRQFVDNRGKVHRPLTGHERQTWE